jgi:hypothetical protein
MWLVMWCVVSPLLLLITITAFLLAIASRPRTSIIPSSAQQSKPEESSQDSTRKLHRILGIESGENVTMFEENLSFLPEENSTGRRAVFSCRVRNDRQIAISAITVRIRLFENSRQIDYADVELEFDPPLPGSETRSARAVFGGLRPIDEWRAEYEIISAD